MFLSLAMYWLPQFLVVASYVGVIAAIVVLYYLVLHRRWILSIILLLATLLCIYARFVEPQMLVVREETISFSGSGPEATGEEVKVALISDIHLGTYSSNALLQRTLEKAEENKATMIVITGDFISDLEEKDLLSAFTPLARTSLPIYAVAGNHDSEAPGKVPSDVVRRVLSSYGVQFVDNTTMNVVVNNTSLTMIGLSDLWEGKMDESVLNNVKEEEHTILFAHNPDTLHHIESYPVDLVLSGHTHGGQIKIPFIYPYFIPSEYKYERGWYQKDNYKLYVTSGLGMTGLPIRLGVPPELVMFTIKIPH